MLFAGAASYALHRQWSPAWEHRPPRERRLGLRVDRVFPRAETWKAAGLATVTRADGPMRELTGQRLYFSLTRRRGDAPPVRSAIIGVIGIVTALPRNPPADSFDGYLANAGMNFRVGRGRMLALERPPTAYYAWLDRSAARLTALLSTGVATKRPELAAAFRAMMLGQKQELGDEQKTLFMHSGTMHLFAINGLHIGVVAVTLHALLAVLRCPRPAAALVTLAVLWLDVDTTGASPSAVRAFLLIACAEVAFVLRRPGRGLSSLATAALIVLVADPMALFSASFQMSYGVVLTVLCFGLPLTERMEARWVPFKNLPEATWAWWQRILAAMWHKLTSALGLGLAASLVGALSGAAFYHTFSPGALPTNLLLVPLATVVIVAGFASVAVGLTGLVAGSSLFNHAAVVLLWVIEAVIRIGLWVPGTWWTAEWRAPWAASLALAALLGVVLAGYATGWRRAYGGFWPPVILVAVAMIFGMKFG